MVSCHLCDTYGYGYSEGKAKAHFELRGWQIGAHTPDCGCDPCTTVRQIVRTVILAAQEPVLLPDSHIEGCEGLGVCSCGCWCHAVR